jgi:phosphoethanolamine N-methyltransferase
MNKIKLILSHLRDGDFAHPGEIDAIKIAMDSILKNPNQALLDIGCGLGGTANYLQKNGWGNVTGIDIDNDVISYAKQHYPSCQFYQEDVLNVSHLFSDKKFDVIYFFTSFFCFPSQSDSLQTLSEIANVNCQLVMFDYAAFDDNTIENPFTWSKAGFNFYPIYLERFKKTLSNAGWTFSNSIDLSNQFILWYQQLLQKFQDKRDEIVNLFGAEMFDAMFDGYENLLRYLVNKKVGGIVIHATKSP